MNHPPGSYDALVAWALAAPMSGWDFDPVAGRILENPPPWDYPALARTLVRAGGGPVLDLGTGGGEVLAGLAPLPDRSAATEAWTPNLPVARARLAPLGIRVYPTGDDLALPFPANTFAVVLARHERYDPVEVRRVLRPGGAFLTQQGVLT